MTIGWYPGHMHKARKDITKALRNADAVIEIVDARLPRSSENPMLGALIGTMPRLRVLNKADLADSEITRAWLDWYARHAPYRAVAVDKSRRDSIRELPRLCTKDLEGKRGRTLRLMILGIPNVGKSTLLNILLDRKVARVANEPAVTRARHEVNLDGNIVLGDTPGILWPRIEDADAAFRLAATGAIRNTAFEAADVALWTVEYLARAYPGRLRERYGVEPADDEPLALLEEIGRRRGCLTRGGVDPERAGNVLLNDLRSGKLGRISLEAPPPDGTRAAET